MSEATATISLTIIHLRTVLQHEIPRSPERPERARSSIAAQTQPFVKRRTRRLHVSYLAVRNTDVTNRDSAKELGASFRRLVRLLLRLRMHLGHDQS